MAVKVNNPPALATNPDFLYTTLMTELVAHAGRLNQAVTNDGAEPIKLAPYTVATLPSASKYTHTFIYVSDGTSNKRLAVSDGTNWRWPDGAIVS